MSDTVVRLRARARLLDITVPVDLESRLAAYFDLLFRWNAKINLTALTEPDAAIDRLLLEPLAAAQELPRRGGIDRSGLRWRLSSDSACSGLGIAAPGDGRVEDPESRLPQ